MNFTQISTFRAVMTSQSLSDAAKKLGKTQPAVSAAIKALEDQLGLELFVRKGRKLIPVPEAQYLLAEADTILSQMARVRQTMRSLSDGQTGTLRVAAMPGPVSLLFPKFIAAKMSDAKDITVSLQARTSSQISELVRAQAIDFGFADAPDGDQIESLYQTEIISADCLVALPRGHPLTEKAQISVTDLSDQPLGSLPVSHAQTMALQERYQAIGQKMHTSVESQTFLSILHFVAAGQCCTVLDPLSVFMAQGPDALVHGIDVRPMRDPIRYRYAIFYPNYRPISVVARTVQAAWREKVLDLLTTLGARPHCL